MSKKNVLAVIFVLCALGYVFFHTRSHTIENNTAVIINDQGFFPDHIVIPAGGTVTWTAQGEYDHWPASNPHPIHNLYPGSGGCISSLLDACRGLVNGESYSFTFNDVGQWGMHDHLMPGSVMVVDVVDAKDYAQKSSERVPVEISSADKFRSLQYSDQLDIIKSLAETNPADAWKYLKQAFLVDGVVVGNAHEFAHIIGNDAYKKFGINGIKICDITFAFGCMHGVTEAMLLAEGIDGIKSAESECLKLFPPETTQDYTGCIHGSGHGLYGFEGGHLAKALADCDIISEPYRPYCYDGVFMENSSTVGSAGFDEKEPWKFCTVLGPQYQHSCARYQSQTFFSKFGSGTNSLGTIGSYCAEGVTTDMRETCFQSLGFHSAQNSLGSREGITEKCSQMPDKEGREICTFGAAQETVFQQYADFENTATGLCTTLTEPWQTTCFSNVNRMIQEHAIKN